ncbi:uncharacterized protein LOC110847289 [Folsomia candida]|uniref:Uncharacterized protein n=1 Tax=Folsomia candida TaxID=158441 RepID=A0A226EHL2_FOLCA|nr:uncharacterized protein LOC110847289 [Folsomia candida]OXA56718.1 hypothetical protein Fcan01_06760 [Folsomia candida]
MKVIAVALLLVAGAFANSIKQTRETGPPCPIADPLIDEPSDQLNFTLNPIAQIIVGGSHGLTTINGLSTFQYEYTINLIQLTAEFTITLTTFDLTSTYTAEGYVDARPLSQSCIPSGNFTGTGPVAITAAGLVVSGSATIFVNLITDRISIRLLSIPNLVFDSLTADLGPEFIIGGAPVDWAQFSSNIKSCVDTEFPANRDDVVEKFRLAINELIADFTLQDFLDLIGGGDSTCPPPGLV